MPIATRFLPIWEHQDRESRLEGVPNARLDAIFGLGVETFPHGTTSMRRATPFARCIGIDYSGASTPEIGLSGLCVAVATPGGEPRDIAAGTGRYWSRRGVAEWLDEQFSAAEPVLVGIDHGLGFPEAWRLHHGLPERWDLVLDLFCREWPAHTPGVRVRDLRQHHSDAGGSGFPGDPRWRRLAEKRAGAKSVFHFDVPGSVATSTHAGLPWIRWLRHRHAGRLHVWPFDGWVPEPGTSVLAEAWPARWKTRDVGDAVSGDARDARLVAAALASATADGTLGTWWEPALDALEREIAGREGWILGVG